MPFASEAALMSDSEHGSPVNATMHVGPSLHSDGNPSSPFLFQSMQINAAAATPIAPATAPALPKVLI